MKCGRDEKLALLLAAGYSVERSAKQSRMAGRTAYRRIEDPVFQQRVRDIRAKMFDRAAARLCHLGMKATRTLEALLDSHSETIKLAAARELLGAMVRLRTITEFEDRLRALERGANVNLFET